MTRRIFAWGGGGFSMLDTPESRRLDDLVIELAGPSLPRVCFLPTASGDAEDGIAKFYAAFEGRARRSHLSLFFRNSVPESVPDAHPLAKVDDLLKHDVVYVGGGNTANLLALWRLHGVDRVLREAWDAGVLLAGGSAGLGCWFEASVSASFGPVAALRDGLSFLPGSCCAHYDADPERRGVYHRAIADGMPAGIALDDLVALRFEDRRLADVLTAKPGARAYRVERRGSDVVEEVLAAGPVHQR